MSLPEHDLLLAALRDPALPASLTPAQWDRLLRQARRTDLLARVAAQLGARGLLDRVPAGPRLHLDSALLLCAAQHEEVRREVAQVQRALAALDVDIVLLKGSAYVLAETPAALGRLFSDVDLLLPRALLPQAEAALMLAGWATTHHNAYDQRYYREWMHELPPLSHVARQTVLDVHHAILPLTARAKPSSRKLLDASRALPGHARVRVLAPVDMVLHSMTHLCHNDELSHGLRDLSDLDLLLRAYGEAPAFWSQLLERAVELQLQRSLAYGLHLVQRILGTPVPADVAAAAHAHGPRGPLRIAMHALWDTALGTSHRRAGGAVKTASLFALYVRAHWLRMPPVMLARHLTVKALRLHEKRPAG